jgi:hypothetical protein
MGPGWSQRIRLAVQVQRCMAYGVSNYNATASNSRSAMMGVNRDSNMKNGVALFFLDFLGRASLRSHEWEDNRERATKTSSIMPTIGATTATRFS